MLNGNNGSVIANWKGNIYELAEVTGITTSIAFDNEAVVRLGKKMKEHITGAGDGTGTMTIISGGNYFSRIIEAMLKGEHVDLSITVNMGDSFETKHGVSTKVYTGVQITGADLSKLANSDTVSTSEVPFTYDNFITLEEFKDLGNNF